MALFPLFKKKDWEMFIQFVNQSLYLANKIAIGSLKGLSKGKYMGMSKTAIPAAL